jgi:hypothetical protein
MGGTLPLSPAHGTGTTRPWLGRRSASEMREGTAATDEPPPSSSDRVRTRGGMATDDVVALLGATTLCSSRTDAAPLVDWARRARVKDEVSVPHVELVGGLLSDPNTSSCTELTDRFRALLASLASSMRLYCAAKWVSAVEAVASAGDARISSDLAPPSVRTCTSVCACVTVSWCLCMYVCRGIVRDGLDDDRGRAREQADAKQDEDCAERDHAALQAREARPLCEVANRLYH